MSKAQRHTLVGPAPCTGIWLLLLGLTGGQFLLAEQGWGGPWVAQGLLLVALLKGWLIADYFMGLRRVRLRWRLLLLAYLVVVVSLIGLAYGLGLE